MIRIRLVLLGLMAVLAISAVAAASASAAAPEFKLSATGKFPAPFTATSKTAKLITKAATNRTVICASSTSAGTVEGAKEVKKVVIKFAKCKAKTPVGEGTCATPGAGSEEIIPVTAKGELVLGVKGSTKTTAIDLSPESGATLFATFHCSALSGLVSETIKVHGSVICAITPTGKLQTTSKLECGEESTGKQNLEVYENGSGATVKDILETEGEGSENFSSEQSAQVVSSEQASKEPLEVT